MAYLISLLFLTLSLKAFAQNIEPYMNDISKAKIEVESNINQTPYQKSQQDIFKKYFTELGILISDIKGSEKLGRRYQAYAVKTGLPVLCATLFLDKALWVELVKKCTKNRFFLCAEEVKDLDTHKESLRKLLSVELREEFLKVPECML